MTLLSRLPEKRPRYVLSDVDDTLAPSTQSLEAPMAEALGALAKAGCGLVFVSGGSIPQMRQQVTACLEPAHVLLGTSGAHAVKVAAGPGPRDESELFKSSFSEHDRAEILHALQALIRDFGLKPETATADQLQDRGTQFTLSAFGRHADPGRKRAFDPDGSRRRAWVDYLVERLGSDRFSIVIGGTTSLDIMPKGVNKGSGVRRLLGLLGIERKDCLYFGDRFEPLGNDRSVLDVIDCVAVKGSQEAYGHLKALLALPA